MLPRPAGGEPCQERSPPRSRATLTAEVARMHEEVATHPEGDYHFYTGRRAAEMYGSGLSVQRSSLLAVTQYTLPRTQPVAKSGRVWSCAASAGSFSLEADSGSSFVQARTASGFPCAAAFYEGPPVKPSACPRTPTKPPTGAGTTRAGRNSGEEPGSPRLLAIRCLPCEEREP